MATAVKVRCSQSVAGANLWGRKCSRTTTVERDGKPYCTQHDPVAVAERRETNRAAWEAKWDYQRKALARNTAAAAEPAGSAQGAGGGDFDLERHTRQILRSVY